MATLTQPSTAQPGEVLLQQGLASDAIPYLLASAQSEPYEWRHLINLGIACRHIGRYVDSKEYLASAARLSPDSWPIYHTWANVLDDIGEFKSSLDVRWRAWELCKRARREVSMGLAVSLLRRGEWQRAWPYWELGRFLYSWSPPPQIKVWQGEHLFGKRLLVLTEGGYGDTFDQARWLPSLIAQGATVTLYVQARQIELLRCSPTLESVTLLPLGSDIDPKQYDYATSILSVPAMLEATPEIVPPAIGFGIVSDIVSKPCQRRIGICWQAEENGTPHKTRSVPGHLIPTLGSVEAEWYSLVPGQTLPWMKPSPANWLDTARLIQSLDMVVSCDTAVAHLAGCLGVPVILMLPINAEWRWLTGRTDTVWYPKHRLVRQTKPDQWDEVIDEAVRLVQ